MAEDSSRTRPGGEVRAFRSSTLLFLGLLVAIVLSAMAYLWSFNLKDTTMLAWFGIATALPLWLCIAACATGFTLVFCGESRPFRVAAWLLLPAFIVDQYMKERGVPWESAYFQRFFGDVTWLALIGSVAYSLAWWLAAARKRRGAALFLATLTGAMLPLLQTLGSLPYPQQGPFPDASDVRITRLTPALENPAEAKARDSFRNRFATHQDSVKEQLPCYVPIFLEGRLKVEGLREDEFISVDLLHSSLSRYRSRSYAPITTGQGALSPDGSARDAGPNNYNFVLRGSDPQPLSGDRALTDYLLTRLPASARLEEESAGRQVVDWIEVDERRSSIAAVEARAWPLSGVIYRIEDAGNFDVAAGGSFRLPSEGMVRVPPYPPPYFGKEALEIRMIAPVRFDWHTMPYGWNARRLMVLLHDPVTGIVRIPTVQSRGGTLTGWERFEVRFDHYNGQLRPEEVSALQRSRLYLFRSQPVARVSASMPPP